MITKSYSQAEISDFVTASHDDETFTLHYSKSDRIEPLSEFKKWMKFYRAMREKYKHLSYVAAVSALEGIEKSVDLTLKAQAKASEPAEFEM